MVSGLKTIELRFADILANLPNRFVAVLLKLIVQPFGPRAAAPSDKLIHRLAQLILEPSAARDRLTPNIAHVDDDRGFARLERAFALVTANEDIARKLRTARLRDWRAALRNGVISKAEAERLEAAEKAVAGVVAVDDFAAEELAPSTVRYHDRAHLQDITTRAASR